MMTCLLAEAAGRRLCIRRCVGGVQNQGDRDGLGGDISSRHPNRARDPRGEQGCGQPRVRRNRDQGGGARRDSGGEGPRDRGRSRSGRARSISASTETTWPFGSRRRCIARTSRSMSKAETSSWSTTCSSPVEPSVRRWTRSWTTVARAPSSWPCWSTAATASFPSVRTSSARTCPRHAGSGSRSTWTSTDGRDAAEILERVEGGEA